jgi:hypothetical protein
MTRAMALMLLAGWACAAAAEPVPLPRPRPTGANLTLITVPHQVTSCDERLQALAIVAMLPGRIGPGACGGLDLVQVDAVLLPDNTRIAVKPAAVLSCPMAESLAGWLRGEAAPRVAKLGSALAGIENYDSYECRTRDRLPGAKISEHAHGDAIDIRALQLADGRRLELTDPAVDKTLRVALRDSACHRFTTVLGPGADVFHSGHVHLDIEQRRAGYRICEWDVREPPPPGLVVGPVPLPQPRPLVAVSPTAAAPKL